MGKVICIGSSTQDVFFPTSEGKIIETPEELTSQRKIAFELGAKYKINELFESLGGCSANVAAGLSRQGISVSHYTVTGNDMTGQWIKKKHEEENIGTDLLEICDCKSDLSLIIVDEKSGERTIFHHKEANEKFEFNPDKLAGAAWVYIGDIFGDWEKIISGIAKKCQADNISVAFNPRQTMIANGAGKLLELFRSCKVIFLNKDEAIEILMARGGQLESQDEKYILSEIQKSGAEIVAITDGERGAWASDGKDSVFVEAEKVEDAKDSTGAGDAFASGFLAAHIKGKNLEECVRWGIKNGASVVRHYGGIEGLLKESDLI